MNTSPIASVASKLGWPTDGRYGVDEPLRVAVAHLEHCWKAEEEVARRRSDETRMMVGATVVFLSVGLFRFGLDVFRDSGLWLVRIILLLGFLALLGSSWMLIGADAVPRLRRWFESRGAMYLKRQGREGDIAVGPERWWKWGITAQSSALLKPDGGEVEGLVEEASRLATPEDADTGDATVRESLVRYLALGRATDDLRMANLRRAAQIDLAKRLFFAGLFMVFVAVASVLYDQAPGDPGRSDMYPRLEIDQRTISLEYLGGAGDRRDLGEDPFDAAEGPSEEGAGDRGVSAPKSRTGSGD